MNAWPPYGERGRWVGEIRTMAQIIGVPDDPVVEEVRKLFSSGSGRVEQACAQREPLSPVGLRRLEWTIAQDIVAAVDRIRAEFEEGEGL